MSITPMRFSHPRNHKSMTYIDIIIPSILNKLRHATTKIFHTNETFVLGYCNDTQKQSTKNPISINSSTKNEFLTVSSTLQLIITDKSILTRY